MKIETQCKDGKTGVGVVIFLVMVYHISQGF